MAIRGPAPGGVICGETGSGKTTQLPKICLELGRGQAGLIGHTQPRRLAARAVASRIAEELRTKVGEGIGFQVRFTDESSDSARGPALGLLGRWDLFVDYMNCIRISYF